MEDILKKVSSAVTDKPITVTITAKPSNKLHALLQRVRIMPSKRVFTVTPLTFGNLVRISESVTGMGDNVQEIFKHPYDAVKKHGAHILRIVAVGLHNKKSDPPKSLFKFLQDNVTQRELIELVSIIIEKANVTGFISTIILIKGLNVLEMSQQMEGSQIAPGTSSVPL